MVMSANQRNHIHVIHDECIYTSENLCNVLTIRRMRMGARLYIRIKYMCVGSWSWSYMCMWPVVAAHNCQIVP